jgi:hypothetical protein
MKLPISTDGQLWFLAIAGIALCGTGFFAGRLTAPSATPSMEEAPAALPSPKQEIRSKELRPTYAGVGADAKANSKKKPSQEDLRKILENSNARERVRELEALLSKTDESGLKQLLNSVAVMPDSPAKRLAMGKMMQRWGELDGAAAAAYGIDNYQQSGNASLLRNALLGWAESDPASSMQYLQGLGLAHGLMNDFSRDVLGVWSNLNPQEAAAYLQNNPALMGNGVFSRGGGPLGGPTSVVARNWAVQDPQSAVNWTLSLSNGYQQGSALNQAILNWVTQDPGAAASYVNSQPVGAAKDELVAGLARGLAIDDPASAMDWVSSISNEETRISAAKAVLRQAGSNAPTLISNSKLLPQDKEKILQAAPRQ